MKKTNSCMSGPAFDKLNEITKNRMKLSLCLIMILEHGQVYLDELVKFTGYSFPEVNKITKDLTRLQLVDIVLTESLPAFKIKDENEARGYLKLLEGTLYLDDLS